MVPNLNWRELEVLASKIRPEIEGLFVDRVIVPARESFPAGYLKGEWTIRLTGRKHEGFLTFSIRPRQPYLTWSRGKGPKASIQATRSPFDLNLSKQLKGAKVLEIEALHRERMVVLWFSEEGTTNSRLGLVLVFIPSAPEAFLVSAPMNPTQQDWSILARSRTIRDESKQETIFRVPDGAQAPDNPVLRNELFLSADSFYKKIETELREEAFQLRLQNAQKEIRQLLKHAKDRFKQSQTAKKEGESEGNWQRLGDLLKGSMGATPDLNPTPQSSRDVVDYETDQKITISCDPKLSIQAQVEKFYQNARRKTRRIQEATLRLDRFSEAIQKFEKALEEKPIYPEWQTIEKLERMAGIQSSPSAPAKGTGSPKKGTTAWLGKSFISKDGLTILAGRSKDENLELTFKHARGNDLWMHVRGRPGAHVVVPLQPGKSAPLETLLDAAHLAIYYSGGEKWGKTEVDYTYKKYVKRIKDSTEASYTHNKTLLIQPDPQRIKKLLEQT